MPSLDILTINDRYRLIRKLGEGGMGEVYLAEDPVMQRQVAIKFIRGPLGDPESYTRLLERFQREARTLAKLSHPNIVHVYDFGEHEGRPYLVMEYLPGGSLAERMGTPMRWQEACALAATVAKALAFAHSEGVLHRDIKPSNILFTKGGEPVVTDFGLAKVLDPGGGEGESTSSLSLIGAAQALGTPAYMAPEQWSGQATERSDIYSLGVVLFQMLTGQVPYPGKTPGEVVASLAMKPLPQPKAYNRNIPKNVEVMVQKALARDPLMRYKNMQVFLNALTSLSPEKLNINILPAKWLGFVASGTALIVLIIVGITNGWFTSKFLAATEAPTAASATQTPLPRPTNTISPTITPTIEQKTPTSTKISPTPIQFIQIQANIPYCRLGPSKAYSIQYLKTGDNYQILGRNDDSQWINIANDENNCWVYVENVDLSQPISSFSVVNTPEYYADLVINSYVVTETSPDSYGCNRAAICVTFSNKGDKDSGTFWSSITSTLLLQGVFRFRTDNLPAKGKITVCSPQGNIKCPCSKNQFPKHYDSTDQTIVLDIENDVIESDDQNNSLIEYRKYSWCSR